MGSMAKVLEEHGFADESGAVAKVGWTNASDYVVVGSYNKALEEYLNARGLETNSRIQRKKLEFLLRSSAVKTLAHKHRAGGRQHVYARMGSDLVAWMPQSALRKVGLDLGPDLVESRVVCLNRRSHRPSHRLPSTSTS